MSKPLIIIPARMASTRFPGKPLAQINGISMLRRTADVARHVGGTDYVIATDHADIAAHCEAHNLPVVMTPSDLPTGSDRVLAAAEMMKSDANILVNLQGDAPFTDPAHVSAVIARLQESDADISTPYIRLNWGALEKLRTAKQTTPFSGTSLIVDADDQAVWFSKNIIPAIRKEVRLREMDALSPVRRHVGLYAYRREALQSFTAAPESEYEALEGLEQLRALAIGLKIGAVEVAPPRISSPGIDTPADLARAEALITELGDPYKGPQ